MSNGRWTAQRTRDFTRQLADYGTTLSIHGNSVDCLAPPLEVMLTQKPDNYQQQIPAEFTVWKTDFLAQAITNNSTFTHGTFTFEVGAYRIDDQEPTVVMKVRRKQ